MTAENEALLLDLVEWVARAPQPYETVMEAWRTSCPRLSIWEDAVDRGLLVRETRPASPIVRVTEAGKDWLMQHKRLAAAPP